MRVGFFVAAVFFFVTATFVPAHSATEPPVITGIEVGDSSCKIEWKKIEGAIGYNVYLQNKEGKYNRLNERALLASNVSLVSLVNGMPYSFAITAIDANGVESQATDTGIVVPVGQSSKVLSFRGGDKAADYHLFSMPFNTVRDAPSDIFAHLPKYDRNVWRLFAMDKGNYKEYSDIKRMEPGKAYWFLSRSDTEIFLSGKTINNYEPFSVQISPGWNIVSSPFLYPVEWREALTHNPEFSKYIGRELWEFSNGGFEKAETLEPFKGYYVFNSHATSINLLIPPVPSKPKVFIEGASKSNFLKNNGLAVRRDDSSWLVKLSADDGIYRDSDNWFGWNPKAKNGADLMDASEPPAWPQHLSLYFYIKSPNGERHSSDISINKEKWVFAVQGGESMDVKLEWESASGIANLELIDTLENVAVDMSQSGFYTFRRSNTDSPRQFIVQVKQRPHARVN